MPRRAPVFVCALALSLAVAGCGGGSKKPYTAAATAPCLQTKGFKKVTTNPDDVGFVAGFAWKTRDLTGSMLQGASRAIETTRDEHWLETHPIDYA